MCLVYEFIINRRSDGRRKKWGPVNIFQRILKVTIAQCWLPISIGQRIVKAFLIEGKFQKKNDERNLGL